MRHYVKQNATLITRYNFAISLEMISLSMVGVSPRYRTLAVIDGRNDSPSYRAVISGVISAVVEFTVVLYC